MTPSRTPIAIIGDGKMARAIEALAPEAECEVVACIGEKVNAGGAGINRAALKNAAVAIEFTEPGAAVANIRACLAAGVPVVVGTTGWQDELGTVAAEVKAGGGALLWSANFSMGVGIMIQLASQAGALLANVDAFDAHIVETHHAAKKDAPSGTAKVIAESFSRSLGRNVPITSVRTGSVPGTHEIVIDGEFEQITLTHTTRDRRVFAEGALRAARWLAGRTGVFTMTDVLESPR